MSKAFPLAGVIGVVATDAGEIDQATKAGLSCVEVRADLLLSAGMSTAALMDAVAKSRQQGLNCLFTARHPSHGGTFNGSEQDRVALSQQALAAGADVVDAELGSEAARDLLAAGAPMILSHHDFNAMPDDDELRSLTQAMHALSPQSPPLAIKVVPTATSITDSVRMLQWVQERKDNEPRRIGFAMGVAGACSRALTIAYGAPITYAAFGEAVAPGQIALAELLETYRAADLNANTRVYGIVGASCQNSFSAFLHSPAFAARGINSVYVLLQTDDFGEIVTQMDALRLDGLSVTIPYKEDALRISDEADERSKRCGAANTLVIHRDGGKRHIHAFNTDYDGVLGPLQRERSLAGLKVAVLGNGGAARGAVDALREAGAVPTLFYRNEERGLPVAKSLAIDGALLSSIDDSFEVYINSTPLGTYPGDSSPVPAEVFTRASQIAFDMVYQTPQTRFLSDAAERGARCIPGREMLVSQGIEQFVHFTGQEPQQSEFQANFERGRILRGLD